MRPARRRPLFAVREPVVFCRPDSVWANEYRTSYDDLRRHWNARAQLLPPYTTLDLYDFSYISVAAERYRGMDPVRLARRVDERMTEEQATPITTQEYSPSRAQAECVSLGAAGTVPTRLRVSARRELPHL